MSFTPDQGIVLIVIAFVGYMGFREWLRHQRRTLLHKERLAAIEKGLDVPSLEQEVKRSTWNVQRTLLLAGLIWTSLGIGLFVTLNALIAAARPDLDIPQGAQWIALAPTLIGLSHLVVYIAGTRKEKP
jgi:uncharacterized protein DUF6249